MQKNNTFKIVSTYISVILGAGFISGSELYFFFGKYSSFGFVSLFFTCAMFFIILQKQLNIINKHNLKQYHDFSKLIFNKKTINFIETVTLIFLFITSSTMISAFCQTLNQSFNISFFISKILIFLLTTYFLFNGSSLIIRLNTYLFPIMFFGILLIGSYLVCTNSVTVLSTNSFNPNSFFKAIIFGILYLSFNSLTIIPMICNLGEYIDSKKTIFYSSSLSAFILFVLGIFLLYPMTLSSDIINKATLPILTLINNKCISYIYTLVLLIAIFSTLLSSILSFTKTIETKFCLKNKRYKLLVILFAIMLSNLGFGVFVSTLYPLFGILGIIQIVYILKF